MKNTVERFIIESKKQKIKYRRLLAILCVLSVMVSATVTWWLRLPGMTLSEPVTNTNGQYELVSDGVTWDDWQDRFGSEVNNTQFAGGVWTDKSVTSGDLTSDKHNTVTFNADNENFLVGLSAIGSTVSIKGEMHSPTDTVIILDLSSSMYRIGSNTQSTANVRPMITAVNNAINSLLSANANNRVGVVAYYGGDSVNGNSPSNEQHSIVFLPLDNYRQDSTYLSATGTTDKLTGIQARAYSLSLNEFTDTVTYSITGQVAGTYMQLGLLRALEQFENKYENNDTTVVVNEETVTRQPVFIFMTDGVATAANTDFSDSNSELTGNGNYGAEWGLNSNPWRSREETDFVTQLTASYAKEEVSNGYFGSASKSKALFYSMGFFADESIRNTNANGEVYFSEDVLNPNTNPDTTTDDGKSSAEILGWWNQLISGQDVSLSVYWNTSSGWSSGKPGQSNASRTVSRTTLSNGNTFPNNITQLDYVDGYYYGGDATDSSATFTDMFNSIITSISEKVGNSPTYVTSDNNHSGYVTFVDEMSNYMEVKKIEGIVLNGKLYSGYGLAKNFNDQGTSVFGTRTEPTAYGNEFFFDVLEQLGMEKYVEETVEGYADMTDDEKRQTRNLIVQNLIGYAYQAGQLKGSTTDETDFSNYIGWYASSASGGYLGFWNDKNYGNEDKGEFSSANNYYTQIPEGANYGIKSYFFLHELSNGESTDSTADLMYVNVWVRTNLETGDNTVMFAVPASVLPTEHYQVTLNEDRTVKSLENVISENFHPIRLVYRVGLDEGLNADTLTSIVDDKYISANMVDGKVRFYANDWERSRKTGYGTVNAYSYFRPALSNDRYYYTENTTIYNSQNETDKYKQSTQPPVNGTYYTRHKYYVKNGSNYSTAYCWMPVSEFALSNADYIEQASDGSWYIKKGIPHGLPTDELINEFASWKTADGKKDSADGYTTIYERNATETSNIINMPYIDTNSANVDTSEQKPFIIGATLGNNGRLSVTPASEQKLKKELVYNDGDPYAATETTTVTFLIHEGEALKDVDYTDSNALFTALGEAKVTLATATITAGATESDEIALSGCKQFVWSEVDNEWVESDTPFQFIFNEKYTVTELNSGKNFDFKSLDGSNTNLYTFTYGRWENEILNDAQTATEAYVIKAVNEVKRWEIKLTKYDSVEESNVLEGAVFGLYTTYDKEKMTDIPEGYSEKATYQNNGTTWYLYDIQTSDSVGEFSFDKLTQGEYLLLELEAPAGYYLNSEPRLISRLNAVDNIYSEKIANISGGPELPSTGGFGRTTYTIAGIILIIVSLLALMYINKRKYGKEVEKP